MAKETINNLETGEVIRGKLNGMFSELDTAAPTLETQISDQNDTLMGQILDLSQELLELTGGGFLVKEVVKNNADRDFSGADWKVGDVALTIENAGVNTRNATNDGWDVRTAAPTEIFTTKSGTYYISTGTKILVPRRTNVEDFGVISDVSEHQITGILSRTQITINNASTDLIGRTINISRAGLWDIDSYNFRNHSSVISNVTGNVVTLATAIPTTTATDYLHSILFEELADLNLGDNITLTYIDSDDTTHVENQTYNGADGMVVPNEIKSITSFTINDISSMDKMRRIESADGYRYPSLVEYFNNYASTESYQFRYAAAEIFSGVEDLRSSVDGTFNGIVGDTYTDGTNNFVCVRVENNGKLARFINQNHTSTILGGTMTRVSGSGVQSFPVDLINAEFNTFSVAFHKIGLAGNTDLVHIYDDGSVSGSDVSVTFDTLNGQLKININNGRSKYGKLIDALKDIPYIQQLTHDINRESLIFINNSNITVGDVHTLQGGVDSGLNPISLANRVLSNGHIPCIIGTDQSYKLNRAFLCSIGSTIDVFGHYMVNEPLEFFPTTQIEGSGTLDFSYKGNNRTKVLSDGKETNSAISCIGTRTQLNMVGQSRAMVDKITGITDSDNNSMFYTRENIDSLTGVDIEMVGGVTRSIKPELEAHTNTVSGISSSGTTHTLTLNGTNNFAQNDWVFIEQDFEGFSDGMYMITGVSGNQVTIESEIAPINPLSMEHPFFNTIDDGTGTIVGIRFVNRHHEPKSGEKLKISYTCNSANVNSHKLERGDVYLSFDSYVNMQSGDKLMIVDKLEGSWDARNRKYKKGEIFTVKNVYLDKISIVGTLYDSYDPNTVHIYLIDNSRLRKSYIKDVTIKGYGDCSLSSNLIDIHSLVGFDIDRVHVQDYIGNAINYEGCECGTVNKLKVNQLAKCVSEYRLEMADKHLVELRTLGKHSSVVNYSGCHNMLISDSILNGDRYAIDFSGSSYYDYSIVNREIRVGNSHLIGNYAESVAARGCTDFNIIHNSICDGGIGLGGRNNKYSDLNVRLSGLNYRNIFAAEPLRVNELISMKHYVSGCIFETNGIAHGHSHLIAINMDRFENECTGDFNLEDCTFSDNFDYEHASSIPPFDNLPLMYINAANETQTLGINDFRVIIRGCTIKSSTKLNGGLVINGGYDTDHRINAVYITDSTFNNCAVDLTRIDEIYIDNVDVKNSNGIGININDESDSNIRMSNVRVINNRDMGIVIHGSNSANIDRVTLNDIRLLNNVNSADDFDINGELRRHAALSCFNINDLIIEIPSISFSNSQCKYSIDMDNVTNVDLHNPRFGGLANVEGFLIGVGDNVTNYKDFSKELYIPPVAYSSVRPHIQMLEDSIDVELHTIIFSNADGQLINLPNKPRMGREVEGKVITAQTSSNVVTYTCGNALEWANSTYFWNEPEFGGKFVYSGGRHYEITAGDYMRVNISDSRITSNTEMPVFDSGGLTVGNDYFGINIGLVIALNDTITIGANGISPNTYQNGDQWRVRHIIDNENAILERVTHSNNFPHDVKNDRFITHDTSGIQLFFDHAGLAGQTGGATVAPTSTDTTISVDGEISLRYSHTQTINGGFSVESNALNILRRFLYDSENNNWLSLV